MKKEKTQTPLIKKPRKECDVSRSSQRGNPPGETGGNKQESSGSGPRAFAWMAEVDKSVDRGCGGVFVGGRTELRIHMSVLQCNFMTPHRGKDDDSCVESFFQLRFSWVKLEALSVSCHYSLRLRLKSSHTINAKGAVELDKWRSGS